MSSREHHPITTRRPRALDGRSTSSEPWHHAAVPEERDEETETETTPSTPALVALVPARGGSTTAFVSRGWAAITRIRRPASGVVDEPILLGAADRTTEGVAPILFSTREGPAVLYVEPEGAFVATLDAEAPKLRRPPERLVPGARAVAMAASRTGGHAFVWDGRRVHVITIGDRGLPTGERAVWLERPGKTARLAAARVGAGAVALVAFDDEPALHVLSEEDGEPRAVRHELSSPCLGLAAVGAGNRAGVVLVLEGGDRVSIVELDPRGRFVERPATRLEGRGARWDSPVALHVENGFALLVRDATRDVASLHRFAQERAPLVTLDRVTSAPAAAWHEKRLWIATASSRAGEDAVSVQVQVAGIGRLEPAAVYPIEIAPPASLVESRADERGLRMLEDASGELSTTTYRDGGEAGGLVERDERALRLGSLRAAIERVDGAYEIWLVARPEGAATDPVLASSFERLARWLRLRLSKEAWDAALAEASWVEALGTELGGRGETKPTEGGRVLVFTLDTLPTGLAFARWMRRVQTDLRARTTA